jgi:hypothetical protein
MKRATIWLIIAILFSVGIHSVVLSEGYLPPTPKPVDNDSLLIPPGFNELFGPADIAPPYLVVDDVDVRTMAALVNKSVNDGWGTGGAPSWLDLVEDGEINMVDVQFVLNHYGCIYTDDCYWNGKMQPYIMSDQ